MTMTSVEVRSKLASKILLMTPLQAAKALSISPRKLWGLTASGEVRCVRIGRSVRYDPRDLQIWIDQKKT